jgi:hypothetical protein
MRFLAWLVVGVSLVLGFSCTVGPAQITSAKADVSAITINVSRGTFGPRDCTAVLLVRRSSESLNDYATGVATINSSKVEFSGETFDILQCSLDMNQRWSSQLLANSKIFTLPPLRELCTKRTQIKIPRPALSASASKALGSGSCGVVVVVGDRLPTGKNKPGTDFKYTITARNL